jgi:hypothetical protein
MTFADEVNKLLADAKERLEEETLGYIANGKVYAPEDVTIVKSSAYIFVPFEHLIDAGEMTEEEARARGWEPTVYPPIPWWRRLRWRISGLREVAALKLYRLVAGHDPEVDCDC